MESQLPQKRLLLIDGTGLAYRAFHAIAELSTKDGLRTNAVFGFIRMLRQLEKVWQPTHRVVVFDGGLPRERMDLLPTYKAQREAMPDALRAQLPLLNEYLACSNIPSLRMEEQEADDVIATLVEKTTVERMEILVATSDKDLYQLVDERTNIVSPSKTVVRMGPRDVYEKTGVWPAMIVPWLALVGDSVDNIPGVPGVGPKTAAKLLARYHGSLEEIWSHLSEITPEKIRNALEGNKNEVLRNVALMQLRRDVPVPLDAREMVVLPPDFSRLTPFLESLELFSLSRELLGQEASEVKQKSKKAESSDGNLMFDFG